MDLYVAVTHRILIPVTTRLELLALLRGQSELFTLKILICQRKLKRRFAEEAERNPRVRLEGFEAKFSFSSLLGGYVHTWWHAGGVHDAKLQNDAQPEAAAVARQALPQAGARSLHNHAPAAGGAYTRSMP
jgi:hypothetical protein